MRGGCRGGGGGKGGSGTLLRRFFTVAEADDAADVEALAGANADFCATILVVFQLTSSTRASSGEVTTSAEGRVAAVGRACNGITFSFLDRCCQCDGCSKSSSHGHGPGSRYALARVMPFDSLLSSRLHSAALQQNAARRQREARVSRGGPVRRHPAVRLGVRPDGGC